MTTSIKIQLAETQEEREAIFRLRYEIYIEEMNRKQSYADHATRAVVEPFDTTGHLFYAEADGEVVGTVRINFRKEGQLECEDLYDMEAFSPYYPNKVSMSTKLMVKKSFRSTPIASLLCLKIYEFSRENDIALDFIDTNPHLVRLYSQVGYRLYKRNIDHPDYGNVIPMVFLLDDLEYLKEIRSPFLRIAKRFPHTSALAELFAQKFQKYSNIRPLFSIDADELWNSLTLESVLPPNKVLSFLNGFSDEESNKLLSMLDLISYERGALVFKQAQESQGLFCILEGSAEVQVETKTGKSTIAILQKGEIFGELGFLTKTTRNASIVVRESAKLLVLTPNEFQKLELHQPAIAIKLLTNLFGILAKRFTEMSARMLEYREIAEEHKQTIKDQAS